MSGPCTYPESIFGCVSGPVLCSAANLGPLPCVVALLAASAAAALPPLALRGLLEPSLDATSTLLANGEAYGTAEVVASSLGATCSLLICCRPFTWAAAVVADWFQAPACTSVIWASG